MRGVLYRTEKDGTTLAVPELRISASNSRTVYYENNAAKQSALNNNEIREGSIVLTGLAGNNEDYATKAYVDSKIGNLEHQVGVIVGFPGNVPNGYLLCDGNRFDKNKYPELYEYLGTDVLPDYRECVLVGAGQNTTDSIATHDVYTVGQFKDDQIQNITGGTQTGSSTNFFDGAYGCLYPIDQGTRGVPADSGSWNVYKNIAFDASRVARAGTVTHGKQKGLNWAIKAAPITISSSPIQYQEDDLLKLKQRVDWDNAIGVSTSQIPYTVPADGFFVAQMADNSTSTTDQKVYINDKYIGEILAKTSISGTIYWRENNFSIPVSKGDIVKITNKDSGTTFIGGYAWFVPFKTVAVKLSSSTSTESISLEDSYSTTEVKTNKTWVDGKPIYRKVVALPAAKNVNDNSYIDLGITFPSDADTMFLPEVVNVYGNLMYYNNYKPIKAACKVNVSLAAGTNFILEYTKN